MRTLCLALLLASSGCSEERPREAGPADPTGGEAPSGETLSPRVAETRSALLTAADAEDWAALDSLASWAPGPGQSPFLYTLGPLFETPSAYWKAHGGEDFFGQMTAILSSSPTLDAEAVGWPRWATAAPSSLSPSDRQWFTIAIPDSAGAYSQADDYVGIVTAIDTSGRWLYYVAGE